MQSLGEDSSGMRRASGNGVRDGCLALSMDSGGLGERVVEKMRWGQGSHWCLRAMYGLLLHFEGACDTTNPT